jgi:hypothetical protein
MPPRLQASVRAILELATEDEYVLYQYALHVGDLHRARKAMIELVGDGHVEIRVRRRGQSDKAKTLNRAEAERTLRSDANWFDPTQQLTHTYVGAVATDTGEALYRRQRSN